MAVLFAHQGFGNNADGLSAGGHDGVADRPHQPDIAAAVDQRDAATGQRLTHGARRRFIGRTGAAVGAAKNTKTFDSAHHPPVSSHLSI